MKMWIWLVVMGLVLVSPVAAADEAGVLAPGAVAEPRGAGGDKGEEELFPLPGPFPYCWDLHLTNCPTVGAKKGCTDGIWYDYVCTCRDYTHYPYNRLWLWDCPEVR